MHEHRNTPTLQDVAFRAKVSTATVSRCLNFPDQVSEKTRDRVNAAIDALGYTPNFGARAMAAQRTKTIGAIIPTMENAVFARGIQAFQEELDAAGYTLLVASSSYAQDLEERQVRSLVARGADALLLIGYARAPEIFRYTDARNIPVLVTWAYDPDHARPSVGFDNRRAMQALAAEVIGLGHRRLGMITVDTASNDRAFERMEGVFAAMAEAGLPREALSLYRTTYSIDHGARGFATLMSGTTPPSAVMCVNDVLAVGAIKQARAMGLDVPGDVSITGFDDLELAQVTDPDLTTVHVPHREMGRRAAQALIGFLEDNKPLVRQELATELTHRASLGPVPRR